MWRWGDGEMGRWGDGEMGGVWGQKIYLQFSKKCIFQYTFLLKKSPQYQYITRIFCQFLC
ncbi:hypothetical protein [Okeania sp. SIO2C2]|uniref:hypothetical protein n=1 Tax=Okeania sp. SIO2C2 TaxID=2607787 RepID=UPI0025798352|nr:hypothetical protein [Okeania sp. SIO2C2]